MGAWLIDNNGNFSVGFRYAGMAYKRSLKTRDERAAESLLKRIEANLHDLENGRLEFPQGADLLTFLLTDGRKATAKPVRLVTLKQVADRLHSNLPAGAKESNTLYTE